MIRWLTTNRVQTSSSVLSAASIEGSMPIAWLRDQLRSKVFRTKLGWDILASFNDRIDFTRAGAKVATITPGTYATAALLCNAIANALATADVATTWTCTYDSVTGKFTITGSSTFSCEFSGGPNIARSIHKCLGYTSTTKSAALSQVAEAASYQSRKWIGLDAGAAVTAQACVVANHNAGAGGTHTIKGSATSVFTALTAGTFTQALTGTTGLRGTFFSAVQTFRYWALLIEDTGNAAGFSEVGIWYLGPYVQPAINFSDEYEEGYQDLSEVTYAIGGAHFQAERADRMVMTFKWSEVTETERDLLLTLMDAATKGKCFFVCIDPTTLNDARKGLLYGFRDDMRYTYMGPSPSGGGYWDVYLPFAEALG